MADHFGDAAFMPIYDTITCYQLHLLQVFFYNHPTTCPVFCCFCFNLFGMCCRKQIQNECIFTIIIKLISLNTKYLGFVLYSIIFGLKGV